MIKIKKSAELTLILIILVLTTVPVLASVPGVVAGNYYYTDITTYLFGSPINSINIGGITFIDAESMGNYGFDVIWLEEERELQILDNETNIIPQEPLKYSILNEHRLVGEVAGSYYYTDITTTLNGKAIANYNIGGRTFIGAEAMKAFGYDVIWSESEKALHIYDKLEMIMTDYGNIEVFEIINWSETYYKGIAKVYEIEIPDNEYAKIHAMDYGAIIDNISLNYENDSGTQTANFFLAESLFGYMGMNYTFEEGIINIVTKNQNNNIPLKVLSYNLYNTQYMKTPLYSTKIKIAVDGNLVPIPNDIRAVVVNQPGEDKYFLFINIEALEIALKTKIFS